MRARSRILAEHSVKMALAAIEVYNKPDFKNREQIFAILMVTSWETLLKAKIVKDNGNRLESIYVKEKGRYKTKPKTKQHFTIGLDEAMLRCGLSRTLLDNIESLGDVRNAAVHLTAESTALPYLVFSLGAATLRNFAKLAERWFKLGLSHYNFYILPLGFSYPFKTLTAAALEKEPEEIAAIVRDVARSQAIPRPADDEFYFVCEIQATLVSAKKLTDATDLTVAVKGEGDERLIVNRVVDPTDQYPYTYKEVFDRVRQEAPGTKQRAFDALIKGRKIKGDRHYSRYNYRSKLEEKKGPSKGTAVIYNEDFVRLAVAELGKQKPTE